MLLFPTGTQYPAGSPEYRKSDRLRSTICCKQQCYAFVRQIAQSLAMSAALDFRKCKRLLLSSLAVSPGTGVCVAKQRHDEIVRNPRIDDIEKQVEQEVQLVSRLVEMRDLPYSDCYRRSIACSRRGSHGDAVLRFFKIAINPRFGIKKGTAFAVPFLVEMRGFEPRFVLLHPTPSTCLFGD